MERHIRAVTTVDVPLEDVRLVLDTDPAIAFYTLVTPGDLHGPVLRELTVELGGAEARQEVVVELAPPTDPVPAGSLARDIRWRPVLSTHLLPVFGGTFTGHPTGSGSELELRGTYRPPLGLIGRFGDGLIGHRIARASTESLLRDMSRRIELRARSNRSAAAEPRP